jgi:hypothetical protein
LLCFSAQEGLQVHLYACNKQRLCLFARGQIF